MWRCLAACGLVAAQPLRAELVSFDGTAALVSDYRFRGVSLSGRDPAVQASLFAGYKGAFAGVFAASVADRRGANAEFDLTAGWSGAVGPVTATAGVTGYVFPGGRGTDYVEGFVSAAKTIGPVELTLGANYAPDQSNIPGGNTYLFAAAQAGIPTTRFTVKASAGYESGGLARLRTGVGAKLDYKIGVEWKHRWLALCLAYAGTDVRRSAVGHSDARGGVVASVSAQF